MYEYIKGILIELHPHQAILDAQGIGYKILIPTSLFSESLNIGKEIKLFIAQVVREDSNTLFGFISKEERELFLTVGQVSGIGPKTALALIGHLDAVALKNAIVSSNVALITKTPGIGKKTAERLIVEMKDKKWQIDTPSVPTGKADLFSDALSALLNLGYPLEKAQSAVESVINDSSTKDLGGVIKTALTKI